MCLCFSSARAELINDGCLFLLGTSGGSGAMMKIKALGKPLMEEGADHQTEIETAACVLFPANSQRWFSCDCDHDLSLNNWLLCMKVTKQSIQSFLWSCGIELESISVLFLNRVSGRDRPFYFFFFYDSSFTNHKRGNGSMKTRTELSPKTTRLAFVPSPPL